MTTQRKGNHRLSRRRSTPNYVHELTTHSKRSFHRHRLMVKWTLFAVCMVVLGGGVYIGAQRVLDHFFFANESYKIVRVDTDLDDVMSREEAMVESGIREGLNIFSIDLDKARKSLEKYPMVEQAIVERRVADCSISIVLHARHPVAWAVESGSDKFSPDVETSLVDAKGNLIRTKKLQPQFLQLPVIYGVEFKSLDDSHSLAKEDFLGALNLIDSVSRRPETLLKIRSIDISRGWAMEVTTDQGSKILFESDGLASQLDRLEKILIHCVSVGRTIKTANLVVKRNTPVVFTTAAVEQSLSRTLAAASTLGTTKGRATGKATTKQTARAKANKASQVTTTNAKSQAGKDSVAKAAAQKQKSKAVKKK